MLTGKSDHKTPRLRISLRHIEVFLATAYNGSTRAAAERVCRSQSATSSSLSELEAILGVQLFDRLGRRLELNEYGRSFLPRAASLLDAAGELEHSFHGQHAAPLRLAASMTIGEHILPALLAQWKTAHPESPVSLQIANSTGVLQAVAALDADIGFIEGPQTHPDLLVQQWMSDEMMIVAAPSNPINQRAASRSELRNARWALREHGSGTREAADRWLSTQLGQVQVDFEMGTPEAIKALVAAGDALAVLPRHSVSASIARGELKEVRTSLSGVRRQLAVVTHRDRRLGSGGEAFLRHCFDIPS